VVSGCLVDQYKIASISFDRWNASTLVSQLTGDGVMMVPIGMGYASQSAPLKELERMVMEKRLIHEGDPVVRWMVRNVIIERDAAGGQKLNKAKSGDKIDGVMALNCAVAEWMTRTASDPDEIPDDYVGRVVYREFLGQQTNVELDLNGVPSGKGVSREVIRVMRE